MNLQTGKNFQKVQVFARLWLYSKEKCLIFALVKYWIKCNLF